MKKHILKIGLLFIIFAAVFSACRQELFEKDASEPVLTVNEAQAWYETSQPGFLLLKSGNKEKKTKVAQPEWKGAFAGKNDKVEVVETHIVTNGGFGFATESAYNQWKATNNSGYITSLTRLVVLKYRKTGEMVSFLMTIVGDKEYLETKHFEMWDNTYLTKDKDFSGIVLFHSPDGDFVNGWRYTKGKVTHTVDVNFDEGFGISLKSGYYDCDIYDIYGWFMDCTINSWNVTIGEVSADNIETECGNPYIEHVGVVYACTYVDDGSGTGGTYTGSSQQSNLSEQLKNIFTNVNNFSDVATSKLNSAFEEINRNCRLKKITTYLEINDIKLGTVSIDENLMGDASYTSNDNLKFAGDWAIDAETLAHEWFHVGQKKMNNASNTTDGYAEFEAWLFFDIQETIRVSGNLDSSNHTFACYKQTNTDNKIEYQNWLKTITSNGTTFPSSLGSQFYYWGPIFAQVRNYTHLSFTNTSYYTKTMFDIKNCNQ